MTQKALDCPRFELIKAQVELCEEECKIVNDKKRQSFDNRFRETVGPSIPVQSNLPDDPVDALMACRNDTRFDEWIEFALGPFFSYEKQLFKFATSIPAELLDLL